MRTFGLSKASKRSFVLEARNQRKSRGGQELQQQLEQAQRAHVAAQQQLAESASAQREKARELEERLEQLVRAERALQQQQQVHDTELERLRKEHLAANKASNADLEQVYSVLQLLLYEALSC
jgi:hypothetical protein